MVVHKSRLVGVLIIEPRLLRDQRGYFVETWHADRYAAAGVTAGFVQDNRSRSFRHTLRGLHYQWRRPQGKLVQVVDGEIFDVAVDIRPESPTFGQWEGVQLSADNFRQYWIPAGFAHGFCVLSDVAVVEYKCTDFYDAGGEAGLLWNDPDLAIDWPVAEPILSSKDQHQPRFVEVFGRGPAFKA
jgi:dTDP-4-dehydrorhamnose 3,5-epimerase